MAGPPVIDLFGALSGLCRHPCGALVPLGTKTCDQYLNWEDFVDGVPDPVAAIVYDAPEIAAGFDGPKRLWATIAARLLPGQAGPLPTIAFAEDSARAGGAYSGSFVAVAGSATVDAAAIRPRLAASVTAGAVFLIAGFQPVVQAAAMKPQSGTASVPASGALAIVFSPPFHRPPDVIATPTGNGGTPRFASALDVTTTGFTLQLLDASGAPTAGGASWNANGA